MLNESSLTDFVWGLLLLAAGLLLLYQMLDPQRPLDRMALGGAAILFSSYYLLWRWTHTLTFGPLLSFTVLWPLFFAMAETSRYFAGFHRIATLWRFTDRSKEADRGEAGLRALGAVAPAVDVFIPTYSEPEPIIRRTIIGTLALDYPNFRVFVLDDGARSWLAELCDELGVNYIARVDGKDAKAGNLNHGIAMTRDRDPAPFIALFDADFVPFRNFLWRTLGFFDDLRVGIVQTPQFFFNPDPAQLNLGTPWSVCDEQRFFFGICQPANDADDLAFCCGSCCVLRRAAIEAVGGIPTGSVIEDVHLTYRLLAEGWVTRYLNEILANGLSTESVAEFANQHVRWAVGCTQALFLPSGPFARNGLTFNQRLHYFSICWYWINMIFLPLQLLAPAVYWFTGVSVLNGRLEDWLYYLLPAFMVRCTFLYWVSQGTMYPFWNSLQMIYAVDSSLSVAVLFLTGRVRATRSTQKGLPFGRRRTDWHLVRLLGVYLAANLVGLWWGMVSGLSIATDSDSNRLNLYWSIYSVVSTLIAMTFCAEVPRRRRDERFRVGETVELAGIAGTGPATLLDISVNGAQIAAESAPEITDLRWRTLPPIRARKLRQAGSIASYRFEIDDAATRLLTVEIYTSGLRATADRAHLGAMFRNIASRFVLRPGVGR
jgi:cellulose synthase (UDP-forming)